MESDLNGKLRKSVCQIYDYIRENLYLNRSDMEIKEQHFNAALLLSVFTGILGSKELIIGEPGLGKTTSAEYVCTLLYGMPLGTIWASEVSGHPEQTEEKIIGRPDLGKLNQGEEVVVWSHFALVPTKIVDEINRLPETKQSMILDGVDRGNWSYLNEAISNREYCLFATCNYEDRGTHTIITPLMDRFDVMVESKHPGANLAFLIGTRGVNGARLRHEQLEQEFHELLNARMSVPLILERMEDLAKSYRKALAEEYGIPVLSRHERGLIYKQIREIPIDLDANAFLRLVLSELSFCYRFGQKRSQEDCEDGCHFTGYLCHEVKNCISNRFPMSALAYAQTMAWLIGDSAAGLDHLIAVLPYTLAHRIKWKESTLALREKEPRLDPLPIYLAKKAVEEVHRRYMEQAPQIKSALAAAGRIMEGESLEPVQGDHPLYWEIRRDLEMAYGDI